MRDSRVVEQSGEQLLAFLFARWPDAKKKQLRDALKFGCISVNGRATTKFDHPLKRGDTVAIQPKGVAAPDTKLASGILIRHEDGDLIVIEKPAGLLSIASAGEQEKTAYALLTRHVRAGNAHSRARVWIVHRLDRETSGLMVFAKNEPAKIALQENWDRAEKKYFAVVEGTPPAAAGKLESHLDESNPLKVYVAPEGPKTRRAVTRYRVMKKSAEFALLELTLETGRRHQIRVQLAEINCPIVGDKKYGAHTNPIRRVALHASSLRFPHPVTGAPLRFQSPLPGDFGRLL